MPVSIIRSTDAKAPALVMCLYGKGGVGKTTLATTAPDPIFIDAEQGTKSLGARGIDVPIIHVSSWTDVIDAWKLIKDDKAFKTVVVDPIDKFLDLLIDSEKAGGEMNIKRWGAVKDRMRRFVWAVKDSGKHVIFIAHEDKDKDDDQQLRRPKLAVNLSGELVDLCDVVGYLRVGDAKKRTLVVQPEPKYEAKDRFDVLGDTIEEPNVKEIVAKIHAAYNKPPFEEKKK